jgi:CRISPR type III-A-associated protein Csm2
MAAIQQYGSFLAPDGKNVNPALIESAAMEDGRVLAQQTKMPSYQLTRFFYEAKGIQKIFRSRGDWNEVLPMILMMKAKVAYQTGKKSTQASVPAEFAGILAHGVDVAKRSPEEFRAFLAYYEALVGFFSGWGGGAQG